MERIHGYSLSSYVDQTEECEIKLFDLCEAFMIASEYNRIGNDDWDILGEQCAQISIVNKHTNEHYTVHVDIDREFEKEFKETMDACHEEEIRYQDNVSRINERIKKVLKATRGEKFVEELLIFLEEDSDVMGAWEIVNEPKGEYQEENYGEVIKGQWVDQWRNGGMEGDDFAGDIYIEIKKDKYLKMYYSC